MKRRRFSLDIRPGAVALLAGLYFLLPLRWCARLALAVTVHELGHVAALVLCGTEIYGLRMEGCGLALRCAPPEDAVRTVAAALAGPAAGAGLFCILRGLGYPEGADLSLLYTCVNLLPVLPLDGGRALQAAVAARASTRQSGCWTCWDWCCRSRSWDSVWCCLHAGWDSHWAYLARGSHFCSRE